MKNFECYDLIQDYYELNKFVEKFCLPEEFYYITLFSRKKYDTTGLLKCDKNCIKSIVCKGSRIVKSIEQLRFQYGTILYDGEPIPEECLAVYITPNPRDMEKASKNLVKKLIDKLLDNRYHNADLEAMVAIQTSNKKNRFMDFDLDFLEPENLPKYVEKVNDIIGNDAYHIIRTRGGYHMLVEVEKATLANKSWYPLLTKLKVGDKMEVMVVQDGYLPVPGTLQGKFVPYVVDK